MVEQHVYTVSELNQAARGLLETTYGDIWIKGEIAELKRAASGHLYFTLKDEEAEISAVRFRSRSSSLLGTPALQPGMVVLAFGRLTIYEPRGRYQFIASLLQPVGEGALQAAFERLKKKLAAEGLFDPATKAPLPSYPRTIAVITSASGAAIRDIVSVLGRRWPSTELLLFPASVQGATAPAELASAIAQAARFHDAVRPIDLVIIGRGGGSAEDLAAFNDEAVARAVHACPIPTVSAVGHEIDSSITDFVADVRAATPSAAAELAAPDRRDVEEAVVAQVRSMHRRVAVLARSRSDRLRGLLRGYLFRVPGRLVETHEQRLDHNVDRMTRTLTARMHATYQTARRLNDLLRLSDPRLPLRRGYSITRIVGDPSPLHEASAARPGAVLETLLDSGRLRSRVEEVMEE
jgi:exodeoxyribonuclease VII large subunit